MQRTAVVSDDSLQFASDGREAEVEIVWLDLARYRDRLDDAALAAWLEDRLQARRAVTDAPLLVADASANSRATDDRPVVRRAVEAVPGTRALGVSSVLERLGHDGLDARATALTASALSDRAVIGIARELAFGTIVPVLEPRIKAVAVDLDGTLYDGVLGEDGPDGIALTETHRELQRRLVALREEGVFLALVTRNEPMDVTALFERRTDMLLRPEHVSSIQIGWGPKSTALESAADELRIATNSVLFLDDNAGEIAAAAAAVAGLRTFHAHDPDQTARALAESMGFQTMDAGGLKNARYLEPLGGLNVYFGYGAGLGTGIAPTWILKS